MALNLPYFEENAIALVRRLLPEPIRPILKEVLSKQPAAAALGLTTVQSADLDGAVRCQCGWMLTTSRQPLW